MSGYRYDERVKVVTNGRNRGVERYDRVSCRFQCEGNSTDCTQLCVYDFFFFFQAEDGIRDVAVTGVQTCALPISVVLQQRFEQAVVMRQRAEPEARRLARGHARDAHLIEVRGGAQVVLLRFVQQGDRKSVV